MNARKRLLLVDGMNLLFQMYYGMPSRIINSQGKAIQGTMGFVGALLKVASIVDPSHVLVIFDGEHENSRCLIDSEYKANRLDDDGPFTQIDDVYSALDWMHVEHFETTDCEADDMIASYVSAYEDSYDITICSHDSDFFQLIGPHVKVLRYRGKSSIVCDEEYLKEKHGIASNQYVDFKCMTGDSADNIKGLYGVGPKTASKLLNSYGNLENLLANTELIVNRSLLENVLSNKDRLLRNKALITMDAKVNRPLSDDECVFINSGYKTRDVLLSLNLLCSFRIRL